MKIAIVGGCASGKSTVADKLCRLGHEAYTVGQEHSIVSDLWNRRDPDALVFLDVSLVAVRQRRGEHWPEWLYRTQSDRLSGARAAADVRVDTSAISIEETVRTITRTLDAT